MTAQRALIVAHGQPSDPGPAEAALAEFAARVAECLPGDWTVGAATLAAPGALEAALAPAGNEAAPLLIYPMFIADGWFTQVNLPSRIREAGLEIIGGDGGPRGVGEDNSLSRAAGGDGGRPEDGVEGRGAGQVSGGGVDTPAGNGAGHPGADGTGGPQAVARPAGEKTPGDMRAAPSSASEMLPRIVGSVPPAARPSVRILPPFGLDAGILRLALRALRTALAEQGLRAAETGLIVAAHGSFKSPAPAAVARRLARAIIAELPFAEMRTAFIDQAPRIAEFARGLPAPSLCLPLFAAAGGHVEEDLPAALAEAGFSGRILAPLGLNQGAPDLVAAALLAASAEQGDP
ncbi:CbiX/SirB N-terminal domain-containing protein [Frigidibacter mobilis]|uniref:Cobalamin biosynthesis CbiX protein n=1 Tax=Frigidibacter mobilis TaxID=1335048 RepID=A0A159Z481_9RHOB|nr:CbiX/SirB N-terminal domain-containing protein [Frigidibacter mobilis]AMY69098.1 cobalamin biosynthesis CbiX protein [Frigidibacter mobilis]